MQALLQHSKIQRLLKYQHFVSDIFIVRSEDDSKNTSNTFHMQSDLVFTLDNQRPSPFSTLSRQIMPINDNEHMIYLELEYSN